MNLEDVMDEVAARLDTIPDLRVTAHPVDKVNVPHAIVSLPEITYDLTYGRGCDRYSLPVVVAVGKVSERASRAALGPFVAGSGPRSFKAVLEEDTEPWVSCDTVRVQSVSFDVVAWGTVDYLTAGFVLDILGPGDDGSA